jgi:hypothetical protein
MRPLSSISLAATAVARELIEGGLDAHDAGVDRVRSDGAIARRGARGDRGDLATYLRIPYTVALVVVGLFIGLGDILHL